MHNSSRQSTATVTHLKVTYDGDPWQQGVISCCNRLDCNWHSLGNKGSFPVATD